MAITAYAVVLIIAYAIYDILVLCGILLGVGLFSWVLAVGVVWRRSRAARAETLPKRARVSAAESARALGGAGAQQFLLALASDASLGPIFELALPRPSGFRKWVVVADPQAARALLRPRDADGSAGGAHAPCWRERFAPPRGACLL